MRISDWSSDVCSSDLFRMKARVLYDSSEKTDAGPYSTLSGKDNVPRWARASRSHCLALIMLSYEAGSRGLADSRPRMIRHAAARSEEHTSELQSLMRISYAVLCLKKKNDRQRQ